MNLIYCFWWFRNEKIFTGEINIDGMVEKLNRTTNEFEFGIAYNPSFPIAEGELWSTPPAG